MPLFFAGKAIYPISLTPRWLQVISHLNPLTYQVDALRTLMLPNTASTFGLGTDLTVLLGVTGFLVILVGIAYPNVAR